MVCKRQKSTYKVTIVVAFMKLIDLHTELSQVNVHNELFCKRQKSTHKVTVVVFMNIIDLQAE